MRRFARLFEELETRTATSDQLAALRRHFAAASPEDAAWAAWLLAGGKLRRVLPTALLRTAAARAAGLPDWLFEASCLAVGDLAETIALVLPPELPPVLSTDLPAALPCVDSPADAAGGDAGLSHWIEQRLQPLRSLPPDQQEQALLQAWAELDTPGRFLLVKLIGGGFRVAVSRQLVQRAIAEHSGLDPHLLAQRMVGWTDARRQPSAEAWAALTAPPPTSADGSPAGTRCGGTPYPFLPAPPLAGDPAASLGTPADWQIEWKYRGIRAQLVRRRDEQGQAQAWLWSPGEELIGASFPDVIGPALALPEGTVLDGELLVWPEGADRPSPSQTLQQRLQRKKLPRHLLAEAPAVFLACDLLEAQGRDLRSLPLHERRLRLEALQAAHPALRIAPLLQPADWAACTALREQARSHGVEGLMFKQRHSRHGSDHGNADGSQPNRWWTWKVEPYRVDAVLLYAQAGQGRSARVHTDCSFAVWSRPPADAAEAQAVVEAITRREPPRPDGLQLLTFTKASCGLSDAEVQRLDRVIRATTLEKFGPVRSLRPTLVCELGFEGIDPSSRHKSGLLLHLPQLLRIRDDKALHEADCLGRLQALITRR